MSDDSLARRHSASVRKMFSRIAGRYDLMNRLMTFGMDRRWRRIAAQAANVPTGGVVLDLGTGTGDLALAFTRHSPAGRVIAADHSIEMLTAARSKLRRVDDGGLVCPVCVDALDQRFVGDRQRRPDLDRFAPGVDDEKALFHGPLTDPAGQR